MIKYGNKISLTMITLNEEASVAKVINDIKNLDERIEINIVDSSTDNTPKIAKSLGANVYYQFPPKGYGPAMDYALKSSNREIIITIDCDDTYPLDQVDYFSRLIIDENIDVVDGNRLPSKPKNMPLINYVANYLFAFIASVLFFKRIKDLHSGMRAYRKEIVNKIPYEVKGVSLPVELILWPIRLNLKVKFVDIIYRERIGQSKLEPLKAAWWTIIRILRARFKKV
jgi:glycosyltransferase involved in cell wall biosynthesis